MSDVENYIIRSAFFIRKDKEVELQNNSEVVLESKRQVLKYYRNFKRLKTFKGFPIVDRAIKITILFKSLGG